MTAIIQGPLSQHGQTSYEFIETEIVCTGPAQGLHHVLCTYIMFSSLMFFMGFLNV